MAEMRGWQDADGSRPFWNAVGARFFGMEFEEADRLSAVQGAGFIADLMPKQSIYTALLSEAARAAIVRVHAVSARAMVMLMDEDFRYEALVDVFDGGPQVHALRDEIRTVRQNRALRLGRAAGRCRCWFRTPILRIFASCWRPAGSSPRWWTWTGLPRCRSKPVPERRFGSLPPSHARQPAPADPRAEPPR
jgi:hypothetical protein